MLRRGRYASCFLRVVVLICTFRIVQEFRPRDALPPDMRGERLWKPANQVIRYLLTLYKHHLFPRIPQTQRVLEFRVHSPVNPNKSKTYSEMTICLVARTFPCPSPVVQFLKLLCNPIKPLTAPADKDVKSAISEKVESKEPVKSSPKEVDDLLSSSKIGSTKPESKKTKKKVLPDIDDDIFSSAAKSTFKEY